MILLPAIDLYEGKVVRLTRGDYSRMTVYREDPLDQAREFEAAGAAWLHTVDLEGARDGATPNFRVVAELCRSTGLQVEVGGGIRTLEAVARYLDAGAARVILGTAAVTDPVFLRTALDRFGDRVAVGVDLKDGAIAIQGWRETAPEPAEAFFQRLVDWGVRTVICTDVSRDGMLGGDQRGAVPVPGGAASPAAHRLRRRVLPGGAEAAEGAGPVRRDSGQGPLHRGPVAARRPGGGGVTW